MALISPFFLFLFLLFPLVASASVLGDVAAQMQPGSWAQVPQTNINQIMNDGTASSLIPYGMNAAWDTLGRRMHYLGGGHGCTNSDSKHTIYDEQTNTWTNLGAVSLTSGCHGWDHISIDLKNRQLYFSPYGETVNLLRYDLTSNGPWATAGSIPITGYKGIIRAFDWFEGALTGAGASGALLCYNSQSTNGELLIYDPEKTQWIANIKGFGGVSTYNAFCEYSRVHNMAIFGGGNLNPNKVWRLSSDRTVTAMPDAPIGLGVHRGNVTEDPVSGNFIVWGSGQLWEYDPRGTGTWTQQSASRLPPAIVADPSKSESGKGMLISASIQNHGVMAYISGQTSFTMYLYKHGATTTSSEFAGIRDERSLQALPNPFAGRTRLLFPSGIGEKGASLKIFNASGHLIKDLTGSLSAGEVGLDAGRLAPGVYFARLTVKGKAYEKRLVLMR